MNQSLERRTKTFHTSKAPVDPRPAPREIDEQEKKKKASSLNGGQVGLGSGVSMHDHSVLGRKTLDYLEAVKKKSLHSRGKRHTT